MVVASEELARDYKTSFQRQWRDKDLKDRFSKLKVPKNFYNKFRVNILSEANAIMDATNELIQSPIKLNEE